MGAEMAIWHDGVVFAGGNRGSSKRTADFHKGVARNSVKSQPDIQRLALGSPELSCQRGGAGGGKKKVDAKH